MYFVYTIPTDDLTQMYIGVGVGIGVFVIVAVVIVIIIVIILRRRRGLDVKLARPDFQKVAMQGLTLEPDAKAPQDSYSYIAEALLTEEFGRFVSIATTAEEQDRVARDLVLFYQSEGKAVDFMISAMKEEVKTTETEKTLFRNNSMVSKMFKMFSKIVGLPYLFDTLALVINQLKVLGERKKGQDDEEKGADLFDVDMEVDTTHGRGDKQLDEDAIAANAQQLALVCQKLFGAIRNSIDRLPKPFLVIFQEMAKLVKDKFPPGDEAIQNGLSGFLFLRFISPAITAPMLYGLTKDTPSPSQQRSLVLISKVMQSLANCQVPGKKEAYMEALNSFIRGNIEKMKELYGRLLTVDLSTRSETEPPVQVTDDVKQAALANLSRSISNVAPKYKAFIQHRKYDEKTAQSLTTTLEEIVKRYGKKKPKKDE